MKKITILIILMIAIYSLIFSGCIKRRDDPNTEVRFIIHNGIERSYRIHIPPSFQKNGEGALVFVLHGGGGTAEGMENYLTKGGFNKLSDENGFIAVYSDGFEKHWNDGRKNVSWSDNNKKIDDVDFFSTLIDQLIEEFNLDSDKVFFTGISNGGQMSYRVACELTHKIAGIAPVVASLSEDLLEICSPGESISVFIIAGTDDPLVPYKGGEIKLFNKTYGRVISIPDTVQYWVTNNQITNDPEISYLPDNDPNDGCIVRCENYIGSLNGSKVIFYSIEGGGHTWPGGPQYFRESIIGKTCKDFDANIAIWDFFKEIIDE